MHKIFLETTRLNYKEQWISRSKHSWLYDVVLDLNINSAVQKRRKRNRVAMIIVNSRARYMKKEKNIMLSTNRRCRISLCETARVSTISRMPYVMNDLMAMERRGTNGHVIRIECCFTVPILEKPSIVLFSACTPTLHHFPITAGHGNCGVQL